MLMFRVNSYLSLRLHRYCDNSQYSCWVFRPSGFGKQQNARKENSLEPRKSWSLTAFQVKSLTQFRYPLLLGEFVQLLYVYSKTVTNDLVTWAQICEQHRIIRRVYAAPKFLRRSTWPNRLILLRLDVRVTSNICNDRGCKVTSSAVVNE
jgi:hypothetical protein